VRTLLQDLRFASRQLWSSRGFTLLAVLTLALGIGANMALFTVIESVLLRPLPYPHSDRLVFIGPAAGKPGFDATSWLNYHDIKQQSHQFADVAGYSEDVSVVAGKDGSQSVVAPRVTANLFPLLGARPLLGRTFIEAEGQPNGPHVALISDGLWRQSFNADPSIVGRTIDVGGIPRTVVGVMPASFSFPEQMGPDLHKGLWLPLQPTPEMQKERGYDFFQILAQLRPGVTTGQAQAELDSIARHIAKTDPTQTRVHYFRAFPYRQLLTGNIRPVFYALVAALALVLLIACANVANLLIARCLSRQQEFAVRVALGASRPRMIRQVLTEGLLLSILGSGLGMAVAEIVLLAIRKLPGGAIPRAESIAIHWPTELALVTVAGITTILSSLLPALLVARADPHMALQAGSRGAGSHMVGGRLSGWLVAGEVALSTLLLAWTGLLFHTLWNLEHTQLGFDTTRITTFTAMPVDSAGFAGMAVSEVTSNAPASVAATAYAPILDRIRHAPGVEAAALATAPPLSGMDMHSSFTVAGRPKEESRNNARVTAASGDYARTLRTPVVRGRMIRDDDTAAAPFVAVINQTLARRYFTGRDPLGQQIELGGKDTGMIQPYTIVGILADQTDDRVGAAVQPLILLPQQQVPVTSLFYQALLKTVVSFVVKTGADVPVASEMRSIFRQTAPGFALDNFQTMREAIDQNTFSQRLGLYLTGSFAGLAVLMVVAGLYGVLAQLVSYRRREIGIRMAVGATRGRVAAMVLRQGSLLIGAGLAAGLAMALASGQLIRGFLYNVQPADALTYAAVAAAMLAVGSLASLIPARTAASVEPMQALREG
jgi:putative ABC transport system permease protein